MPMVNGSYGVNTDNDFGPLIRGSRDDFDFTLVFQQSILAIIPSTLLLLAASIRLYQLLGATRKKARDGSIYAKQVTQSNRSSLRYS